MAVALIAPGRAMLRAPGKPVLWHVMRGSSASGNPAPGGSASPTDIAGLSGWWDASTFAGMADSSGRPLAGWNLPATCILDRSGVQAPITPFRYSQSVTTLPVATPRISGLLGGCGLDLQTGPYYPTLDYDLGFKASSLPLSSGTAWTRALVWSRPNWKQNPYSADGSPSALFYCGTSPVLAADGSSGSGKLILFPGQTNAVLSSSITRRHTHAVVLRNVPGSGVDVWLDGQKVASSVSNPLTSSASGDILLLHTGSGVTTGAGQCWFHELCTWERVLSDAEISELTSYLARWSLGPRKGVSFLFNGQSNARNAVESAGADLILAKGVAWYLGAIAYGRASKTQTGGPGSIVPGMGIYYFPETANPTYAGTFLDDPLDGSDPSTWTLGSMGNQVAAWVQSLSAEDRADVGALIVWWSETDSYRPYSDKSRFQSAARRWITLLRSMFPNATPQILPVIWWNAIPFGNTDGIQMHREVAASICADPTLNVVLGNPMTADSNNLDNGTLVYDATTGIQSGGDSQHRDLTDLAIFARRAAPVVAASLYGSGRSDSLGAIPAGLPRLGGPSIIHAYRESATSVVLTVAHDAGNDLRVPLQAANGAGFLVMDGGSVARPGTLVPATACARMDATHLRLSLSKSLTNPSPQCLLFYPYGSYSPAGLAGYTADLGRGNAVTDNFSAVNKPPGWDIGMDLGSAWNIDFPLAATSTPIPLSDSPT